MSGIFEAQYDIYCLACEERIFTGDQVKWADGSVIHAECMILDENFQQVRPACPKCFQVPASNGECGCDR